jgi:hypothetical protein
MKFIAKIIFLITTLFALNSCDAQTLNDVNNALNQTYGKGNSSLINNGPVGVLTKSTISGFNKICYYNKFGSVYTINIPSTHMCPLRIR